MSKASTWICGNWTWKIITATGKEESGANACCFNTCWLLPYRSRKAPLSVYLVMGGGGRAGDILGRGEKRDVENKKYPKKCVCVQKKKISTRSSVIP